MDISSKPTITGYYTDIKTNWNLNPIMQISISDSSSSPTEFNSFGQWDGIISGCDCSNSTYATILKTVCNSTMTSSNCINITDIPSVPYSKWKGKFINVERLSAYTFKNYLYIQTKQNCKKGYKKCGVLDSMNHTLCVSNEAVCPINKLLIDLQNYISLILTYIINIKNDIITDARNKRRCGFLCKYCHQCSYQPCCINAHDHIYQREASDKSQKRN